MPLRTKNWHLEQSNTERVDIYAKNKAWEGIEQINLRRSVRSLSVIFTFLKFLSKKKKIVKYKKIPTF